MRVVSSSVSPTVMNSASRDPVSSSTPSAAYLASTSSAAVSVMPRNASAERLPGADRHHRVEQPQHLLRAGELEAMGTSGGYGNVALASAAMTVMRSSDTACPVVIRVFLLDDHEVVRRGVRELLETADDIEVVGEAATAPMRWHERLPRRPTWPCSTSAFPTATGSRCVVTCARCCPTCAA